MLWKLAAEYVIVRSVIKTREQAMRCLWLLMASAAIVCVVGILQSLNLLGVPALLAKYYAPLNVTSDLSEGRGSSLLALPAAVADLAIIALAIAVALIVRGGRWRWLLCALAVIYAFGVVAAAEFSTLIGLRGGGRRPRHPDQVEPAPRLRHPRSPPSARSCCGRSSSSG